MRKQLRPVASCWRCEHSQRREKTGVANLVWCKKHKCLERYPEAMYCEEFKLCERSKVNVEVLSRDNLTPSS